MRRAITSIGEVGISVAGGGCVLRPSFAAMDSLGSPSEIVEKYVALHSAPSINPAFPKQSYRRWEREALSLSVEVMWACTDDDISAITGYAGSRLGSWVPGTMPISDMIPIARCLLKHGIIGALPKVEKAPTKEDYSSDFKAHEYVAQAVAHLGISSDQAWNMTMTEFGGAMRAKFGKPESNVPSLAQYDEDMARLEEINQLRGMN